MKPIIASLAVLTAPHVGHPVVLERRVDELAQQLRPLYADGGAAAVSPHRDLGTYASSDRRVQALLRTARTLRFDNGSVGLMLDFHW